jgi:DNA primase
MERQKVELQNIIQINIEIAGRVTQSDIIGAVFGQTEQVLGEDLDLRKLQREGQLGRIEVDTEYTDKGTFGTITIPSHMDRTNTVVIAAALETIEKIGPCQAKARVKKIENIKEIKVREIILHAKEVLKKFMEVSVDSQEIIDRVNEAVRVSQATDYKGVPCGPSIEMYDELLFVETVDELNNLLKNSIKNVVAFENFAKQDVIKELTDKHEIIAFVSRGKEHLVRKLMEFADVDHFATPDGHSRIKDMNSKELHKAIRNYVSTEQLLGRRYHHVKNEGPRHNIPEKSRNQNRERSNFSSHDRNKNFQRQDRNPRQESRHEKTEFKPREIPESVVSKLKDIKKSLAQGEALVLDANFNPLGKLPLSEVAITLRGLPNVKAIVVSGEISGDLVFAAEKNRVSYLAGDKCARTSNRVGIIL